MQSVPARPVLRARATRAMSRWRSAAARRLRNRRSASASAGGATRRRSTDWWRGWRIAPAGRFIACRTCNRQPEAKGVHDMSSLQEMKIAADGQNRPKTPIYLDYQATTPTDPRVVEAMLPYFTTHFGNPHSRNHSYGWEAEQAVEKSRAQVAAIIGADEKEIIFTSGATESNDLAIQGVAHFYKGKKNQHITVVS